MASAAPSPKHAAAAQNFKVQPHGKQPGGRNRRKITLGQLFQLARRLAVFAAAVLYIYTAIAASTASIRILSATSKSSMEFVPDTMDLIGKYMGTGTVRHSPLVANVLGDKTAPQNGTLYLESDSTTSFTNCSTPLFSSRVYGNTFLRALLDAFVRDAAYNLTFLTASELVVPVVDCSSTRLVAGDTTAARLFYLMRNKTDTESVFLLTFSLSMQDYSIPKQIQNGPGGIASITKISDMGATPVTHYFAVAQGYPFGALKFQVYVHLGYSADYFWRLESIPAIVIAETPKEVVTARRTGFYMNTETEQSNVKNKYWALDTSPIDAISKWRWMGGAVLRDTWAWVHCIHIFFAFDALFSLGVLFLVIYHNLQAGKIWVGDAFVSISNSLVYRGPWILLSWYVNEFWTLMEFLLDNANILSKTQEIFSYQQIIEADMMTIYLSLISVLGFVMRERIDPALAIFLFVIGFDSRLSIATIFPHSLRNMKSFAIADHAKSILDVSETVAQTTPLRFWTIHAISSREGKFVISSLVPIYSSCLVIVCYALVRKAYHHKYPEQELHRKATSYSNNKEAMEAQRGNLTLFEVATGAALQSRLGLVCDYANCKFIKGIKYASADGIYCSGYVIANGKYLIASSDLKAILVMKITRLRFRNIYAYEVAGSSVQQNARLVYPQTISWHDLLHLNISVLS
ncbi:hypothetical protein Gpo141_00004130 [Globisporangium polare]